MIWDDLLSKRDRKVLSTGRFGHRMGFGNRPAVLCIDCQVYMVGDRDEPHEESIKRFPSSCGHEGWIALEQTAKLLEAARSKGVPVFYTVFTQSPDGSDAGVYALKRDLIQSPNWALENTLGSEISPLVRPHAGDMVIPKKKPSAFFGTPFLSYLINRQVDTLIITGGATSNCVRASVFDSFSYNFRTIVVAECVFDRYEISHKISLFDMDRQFADVVNLNDVLDYLSLMGRNKGDRR